MKSYSNAVRCVCVAAAVMAARGQTQIDLRTQVRNIDFSTAASTRPSKTGTSLPAGCAIGETFLKTDAEAGRNLYVCTAPGVWTVQGVGVPIPTGNADQVLSNDGAGILWQALGGDLRGRPGAVAVTGLQSRPVATSAPATGAVLTWDGAQWAPQTQSGGGGGPNTVDKTVSNTYTAGAKQTFVPSLAASGVNVTPGTLPTNPVAGDVAIDSGDANKLKVYDGGQWNTLGPGNPNATINTYAVAGLPASPTDLTVAIASDGNPGCLAGGGTRRVVCQYHSGWLTLGVLGDVALVTSVGSPGSNANIATEKGVRSAIAAVTAAQTGAVADPGGNGLMKRTSANVSAAALAGTDYATATNGSNSQGLTSNGAGGFGTPMTLAASATADTTNASNITTGTLPAARLPGPSASTLGGVQSAAPQPGKLMESISTAGVPTLRALVSADIPGNAANTSGNAATATALAGLPGDPSKFYTSMGTWAVPPVGGSAPNIFTALHTGFTAYSNPASSITGTVSYTDYSSQAAVVYRGPGIVTFTEPMSLNRTVVSIPTAFQAAVGAPAIAGLQISLGTASNATAYMNPVQVAYTITSASCAAGVGTFVLLSPVPSANQTPTVVISGVVPANYNGTFTPTAWTSTTFNAPMTCAAYVSGGMVGLQGLIAGNFAALPQGMSGTNTAYLYLTVTNPNPATFTGHLLAGAVKVMLEGVQVQ